MNPNFRNIALWAVILVLVLALVSVFQSPSNRSSGQEIPYSAYVEAVEKGRIEKVTISGFDIQGSYNDGSGNFSTYGPSDERIREKLRERGINVTYRSPNADNNWFMSLLATYLPFLVLIGIWIFMSRQMQNGAGRAMGFGKSKAKLLTEAHGRVTFEDVAGIDEAKEDLQEIVEFLRDPQKFQRLGGRIPRGVLLVGPPGTGKTLTARAVAGEANVPFFTISGSDFVEMFVGVGASRVRDMFAEAKKNAPCIIFIDEIDAVGRHRGAGLGGGNDEREQTLNQLLVEMDGFEANEGVIIIAATNRPDVLDPALMRPGRFDRQIVVPLPDVNGREKILKVHTRKVPMAADVNLKTLARGTPGFSGADLMNLVNEAALLAARRNRRIVTMLEFEDAKDKVMMGAERKSMAMSDEEKKNTAYHEAGHAIIALKMAGIDPIHKATIIPRGRSLGMVMTLPEGDRYSMNHEKSLARLAMLFGGREAEIFKNGPEKVTNGATGDIQMATSLARAMVMEWGMSDTLGRVRYASNQQEVFLGHSVSQTTNMSDETAKLIDEEVRKLIEGGEKTARRIITENAEQFEAIAQALLEFETLTGDELRDLMDGKRPKREDPDEPSTPRGSAVPTAGKPRPPEADGGMEPQPQG
ncbi:MAG: ATP-dependent zinc metalloprotease FtsH [Proteobacteria bacterium]|nr:ATP-dependent zinc metalloprotease FtsH [Pseudomonadota bacterium]